MWQEKDMKNYIVYIEYNIEVKVLYFHNMHYLLYYIITLYTYIIWYITLLYYIYYITLYTLLHYIYMFVKKSIQLFIYFKDETECVYLTNERRAEFSPVGDDS